MSRLTPELLTSVLELPEAERVDLAARMLDSVDGDASEDVQAAWIEECRRRIAESDAGLPGIPAAEVWSKLDERKRARSSR